MPAAQEGMEDLRGVAQAQAVQTGPGGTVAQDLWAEVRGTVVLEVVAVTALALQEQLV